MRSMLLVLAVLAAGAHADEGTPCDNVETTQQAFECSAYNKTTSEHELDNSYKDMVERISAQNTNHPAQLADYLGKIKNAQEIWKKLRDADCAVQTFANEKGSQAFQVAENDCIAQMSDERSEYLQSIGIE
ncbi:lysozyme inhibitor LprI family protein [Pseudomonas sp. NA-150]|uniref:lysozyme inhibitor LprI family protein n=1 Tax=Pseudomonas sp. NA-150 TaxID=3367525 RepID=UPI0037CC4A58